MSLPRLIGLILALITLLVYLPATRYDFTNYDDTDYVTENQTVQNGISWTGIKWAFAGCHASNWHPVTWLSHMLDCDLFHLNPGGHHLVSILFHSANAALLFALLFLLTNRLWLAAFIAALFAWHPLHVESVAWISERKDVLSTFFALLALLSYARYSRIHSKLDYGLALAFFALGLMAKPMLVTLPFVMLLLDYWPLRRFQSSGSGRLFLEKWPFFLLSASSCVITFLAQRNEAVASLAKASLGLRAENVIVAYFVYLFKTVWPLDLAVFYPLPKHFAAGQLALAVAVLVAVSVIAWLGHRQKPYLLTGWLWFLGTLVPVIGLVQVGDQALADRYTYFPLIGIFTAVTFVIADWAKDRKFLQKAQVGAAVFSLAACLVLTTHQLEYWQNSETLFTRDVAVTGGNSLAYLNLGAALQANGKRDEALINYRKCLDYDPKRYEAWSDIAKLLYEMNQPGEALTNCLIAEQLNPQRPAVHNSLGLIYAKLDRWNEAMNEFSTAIQLNPGYATPRFQMGQTLLKLGRDEEAIPYFQQALTLDPDNIQMLIRIARVRASDEDPQVRNAAEALALGNRANALATSPQPVTLDTLAMACAEARNFDDAIRWQAQAIQLAGDAGQKDDAAQMQHRAEFYKNHQPWRESFRQN